ncbi:hypothetical protein ABZ746_39265 [Streptomyces sp. NPDC020096]
MVIHTRLALAVIDTAAHTGHGFPHHHASVLIEHVLDTGDGYAARDILEHPTCSELLGRRELQDLRDTVALCALSGGQTAEQLREHLAGALDASAVVIHQTLA